MTPVDYILAAAVLLSVLFGVVRGFLRESVALLGWLVGLWLAWRYAYLLMLAPLAVVRGRHRFRLLVKSPRGLDLSAYLRGWLAEAPKPRGNIRLEVDVDPQSFY